MRTLKMDGMEKVLMGHHRHEASARGLHQVRRGAGADERLDRGSRAQGLRLLAAAERWKTSFRRLEQLNEIGASLSAERDINRLLESILLAAKTITRADGGTLYRADRGRRHKRLRFEIMRTDSLEYCHGRHHRHADAVLSDPPVRQGWQAEQQHGGGITPR